MHKAIPAIAAASLGLSVTAHAQFTTTFTPNEANSYGPDGTAMTNAESDLSTHSSAGPNEPYVYFGDGSGPNLTSQAPILPFPGKGAGTGGDNFAVSAAGTLTFNTAGTYTFSVNSDDGFRLRLNASAVPTYGETADVIAEYDAPRGPNTTTSAPITEAAGATANVLLSFYQNGGGSELEFTYSLNGGPQQQLVGTSGDISVSPTAVPEPSTWMAAGGLLLLAAGDFRRRLRA